jgi:ferredoxin/flavodoxin
MKTVIYYFTGTGNSLAAAKKIAAALGETRLVPVASLVENEGTITPEAERVGIVCPVYFAGLPLMVASFAERLRPDAASYVFAVVTYGGSGAAPALGQLDGILREHASRGLDSGFSVRMPGNYILMYESPKGPKRAAMLGAADEKIARIVGEIRECLGQKLPRSFVEQLVHTLGYGWFRKNAHDKDRTFTVLDNCTSCGTCVAVCPAGNITLVEEKPVFSHHCEVCCACIHACPVQAIQAGSKTGGRERYRNPDVTLADLKIPNTETP